MSQPAPLISEVITALLELQAIIGDQHVTLAQWKDDYEEADVPLPGICGLGLIIHQSGNGEVKRS